MSDDNDVSDAVSSAENDSENSAVESDSENSAAENDSENSASESNAENSAGESDAVSSDESSSGLDFDEDRPTNESVVNVFGNDMLLEMILAYSLFRRRPSNPINRPNLCSFRLVGKNWQHTANKLIEQRGASLYTVLLTPHNTLNQWSRTRRIDPVEKEFPKFVQFLEDLNPPDCYKGFTLKLTREVFRLQAHEQLVTCLQQIGHHLKVLQMEVPKNGGSFPGLFPNTLSFSTLQTLCIEFSKDILTGVPRSELSNVHHDNSLCLLQSLLLTSLNLKVLAIGGQIPSHLQFMQLPSSLSSLWMNFSKHPKILECLFKNRLPNLTVLQLVHCLIKDVTQASNLLYKALENLGETLRTLCLAEEVDYQGPPRSDLKLRFPEMKNLRELQISGIHSELESGIASISTTFPKLRVFRLQFHTEDMLKKWTTSTPTPTVTKFCLLDLVNEQRPRQVEDYFVYNVVPVSIELMQGVHLTFPNITDLSLSHSSTQFENFQYIFREMRQLTRLSIWASASPVYSLGTSDHWDSMFIGAPLEFVVGLKGCPKSFWKNVKLENEIEPSIRMLKELQYLQLEAELDKELGSLISDLTFIFALNAMPKLNRVQLTGQFLVSKEIGREWRRQNRTVMYFPE